MGDAEQATNDEANPQQQQAGEDGKQEEAGGQGESGDAPTIHDLDPESAAKAPQYQIWSLCDLGITNRTVGDVDTAREKVGDKSLCLCVCARAYVCTVLFCACLCFCLYIWLLHSHRAMCMLQFIAALAIDPDNIRTLSHYGCFLHTACVDYSGAAEVHLFPAFFWRRLG